ncbi:hypothetical protein [Dactylosporangium darangshiense]|uniref:DUF4878 domain-containing protein n=1 Tax=Dactylosporangium darangshiense TaxID=579108 RepID=A0ABP8CZJ7_9ACTN
MTRTRRWILAGAALAALVAAGAVWWALRTSDRPPAARGAAASDDSVQAVDSLVSRLPEAFAAGDSGVLSSAARERGIDLRQALPAGAKLAMDRSTWRRTGAIGSATVTMTVAGRPPVRFVVVVIREDGAWKVSGTYDVAAA